MAPSTYQDSLIHVRRTLLDLHKGLIDRARTEYEKGHGPVSPGGMLQLLISDDQFSWLRPISELIVRVDELVSQSKERRRANPARTVMSPDQLRAEAEVLLVEIHALLTSAAAPDGFRERYDAALQRDPSIAQMHRAVVNALPAARDQRTH